jgi:hypothetical protein
MDRPEAEDETARRIGLFFVGLSVAALFAVLGSLTLPMTDVNPPSPHNEVKWSAVPDHYVDHPLLATPWVVAGLGVGVMAWTVFDRRRIWRALEVWQRPGQEQGAEAVTPEGRTHFWARFAFFLLLCDLVVGALLLAR